MALTCTWVGLVKFSFPIAWSSRGSKPKSLKLEALVVEALVVAVLSTAVGTSSSFNLRFMVGVSLSVGMLWAQKFVNSDVDQ